MSILRVRMAANENNPLKQWIWRRPSCIAEAGAAIFRSGEKNQSIFDRLVFMRNGLDRAIQKIRNG
jgi:hypothetical protein